MSEDVKVTILTLAFVTGKAFGWCLLSFSVVWAIVISTEPLIDLVSYLVAGFGFLIVSKMSYIELIRIEKEKND